MYKCKSIGCPQNFNHTMQLKRHRDRQCSKPQPSLSYIEVKDGFKCCRCSKVFLHQSNASRHAKKCSLVKTKFINRCGTYSKTLNFKSELKRHQITHLESTKKTCSSGRLFKRMDHFKKYLLICTDNCDFVPSFASSAHSTLNHVNQDSGDLDIESEPDLNASTVEKTLTSTELDHVEHTSVPVEHSSVSLEVDHIFVDLNHDVQSIPILVEGDHAEHRLVSENDEGLDFSNNTSKSYCRDQKKIQRHSKNTEDIIKELTSPVKTVVFSKVIPKETVDDLDHTTCESVFEAQVCQAFIERLKTLNREKKYPTFHQLLHDIFGEQLQSQTFLDWLAKRLDLQSFLSMSKDGERIILRKAEVETSCQSKPNWLFIILGSKTALFQLMEGMAETKSISLKDNTYKGMVRSAVT